MKTFARLIWRYVLTAVGVVLLLLVLTISLLGWISWREGYLQPQREYSYSEIADSMVETDNGMIFGAEHAPEEWMDGYAWAMILDEKGNVKWNYDLPDELDNHYSSSDIASFSRWYLDDYPVFCWSEDYGLFVAGLTKGSLWKYNLYNSPNVLQDIVHGIPLVILGMLLLVLIFCLWIGWRGTKRLRIVAEGLDALADGQTVQLPTDGFTGELAQKLNQTSSHLQKRNEMLVRRDDTRTQWIAGVSHDVRTPLALILGWGEQLEQDSSLPDTVRHKAAGIRTQCEKLRSLIDDLNLTSKLEYGAQPLRKETFTAGPLFRELVAQFYDSPLAENCEITLNQTNAAEHAQISVDRALLARLLENLLSNSVRHNSESVKICIETEVRENFLEILAALNLQETTENTPHILGLHVVEQIAAAHGGKSIFESNYPSGARTCVWLPLG